jgi:hypothetical protein
LLFSVSLGVYYLAVVPRREGESEMISRNRMNLATIAITSAILLGLFGAIPAHSGSNALEVSPAELRFGKVHAGQTSTAKTVTLSNQSNAAVSIQSVIPSRPFATTANNCGSQIAAKPATCQISVVYAPPNTGNGKETTQHGKLTIIDGATNSPQVVALSGIKLKAPPPRLTPGLLLTVVNGVASVDYNALDGSGGGTIVGPHTKLLFPLGVAADSKGNIYVANIGCGGSLGNGSITVYRPGSSGDVAPIRVIKGDRTGLLCPAGVAVDSSGKIYVANNAEFLSRSGSSVTVYPAGSNGNVKPIATISGNNTGLVQPNGIALDPNRNIYVADNQSGAIVYPAGSDGNVAPSLRLAGGTAVAIDESNGNIYAADFANNVNVYSSDGSPIATIGGTNTELCGVEAIALDSVSKIYIVSEDTVGCGDDNTVTVYPAGSSGDIAPIATISLGDFPMSGAGLAIGPVAPPP